jgi:hypothetical protein
MSDSTAGSTGTVTEVSNGTPESTGVQATSGDAKGTPPRDGQGRFRANGEQQPEGAPSDSGGHQASNPEATSQAARDAEQAEAWLRNKRKVKVNGTEREVTAEEAFQRYQLTQAAHERMQKAAEMEKKLKAQEQQLQQFIKQNPVELLRRVLGPEQTRRLMEQEVTRHLEWDLKKPEERERTMLQHEREQFERQRKAYEKQVYDQQVQQHAQSFKSQYAESFPKALQAAGLPNTPAYIKEMAVVAQNMLKAGIQWTPEDVARVVAENEGERERQILETRRTRLSKADEQQVLENLKRDYGDDILNKLRKADVERLKPKASTPEVAYRRPQQAQQSQERPLTIEELRERMEKRRGY